MKKIFTVLMMTLMMAGLFAKPVDIETDNYYILTDDENTQKDFSGSSNEDIISLLLYAFPKKTGEYENKYVGFSFCEVDGLAEKYFNYLALSKYSDKVILVQNLGDGRQLMLMFKEVKAANK